MTKINAAMLSMACLGMLAISACTKRTSDFLRVDPGAYPPIVKAQKGEAAPSPEQKAWALSLGAVLTKTNGERLDLLGGAERTQETTEVDRELMADYWNIHSREDLLDTLAWIEQGGHRKSFDDMRKMLAPAIKLHKLDNYSDPVMRRKVDLVLRNYDVSEKKSIAAWDFGRYVNLCGWGFEAGYLTEAEAWQKIMPVARTMQSTFDSWQDFGFNYYLGRSFWSQELEASKNTQRVTVAFTQLMTEQDSPWHRIPWKLDLTDHGNKHIGSPPHS